MMRTEQREIWRAADRLFCEWLQLDDAQRAQWPAALAADDAVRRALDRLIAAHRTCPDQPVLPSPGALQAAIAAQHAAVDAQIEQRNRLAGRRVGDWELVEEIGRGGMSVVYRAERVDSDFRQQAAVKLLGLGLIGTGGEQRFAQERRVLASLDHPHIARLIDGGIAEDGTPFLVMHLVQGVAIDAWCTANALDLAQRLRLLVAVCDAVAYAHRNLVVHRDLKPANILVCSDGVPVLLDFGIAQLLDPGAGEPAERHTRTGMRALTPGFAAPEQHAGGAITTATDVYGLGAVLERLCADCAPLPRDVANIVAMAQREEPERRYPDARALAADLRRFLALQPVHASPDSGWYRLRVLARRRRGLASTLLLAAVLLASGVGAVLWEARKTGAQAARAEAIRDFLIELLAAGDIESSGGKDPRVSDLIAAGTQRVGSAFPDSPALRAEMSMLLGNIETMHGDHARAGTLLADALAYAESEPGDGRVLSTTLLHLGTLANRRGEPEAAVEFFERALDARERHIGTDERFAASVLFGLAYAMDNAGRGEELRQRIEEELAVEGAWSDPAARIDVLTALSMLQREPQRKLELMLQVEALQEVVNPPPVTQMSLQSQLATAYDRIGDPARAVAPARRALAIAERIYPSIHVTRARMLSNLGSHLNATGDWTDALAAFTEAERVYRALGDSASPSFAALLNNRGVHLRDRGQAQLAVPVLAETVELARRVFGAADRRTLSALRNLIAARVELGPSGELEADVAACLAGAERMDSDRDRSACLLSAAQAALVEGRPRLALERLEDSAKLHGDAPDTPRTAARRALTGGRALAGLGRHAEAASRYRDGLAALSDEPAQLDILGWQLHAAWGDLLAATGDAAAARTQRAQALVRLDALGLGDGSAARQLRALVAGAHAD